MSKLYLKNGYLNPCKLLDASAPFTFCVGGRGIGKTYGVLQELWKRDEKLIYMRRTETQMETSMSEGFSPWNAIPEAIGLYVFRPYRKTISLYRMDGDVVREEPSVLGLALSTFSNIRGINAPDIKYMVFDEFIPEPRERLLKDEGGALKNAYETINRNRELEGYPPLKLICLANSNRADSPILQAFNLTDLVLKMRATGQEVQQLRERGIQLICPLSPTISELKAETALYKASKGTRFAMMAIENRFQLDDVCIKSRDIRGMKAIWCIGEAPSTSPYSVTIYNGGSVWYVTHHYSGTPVYFDTDEISRKRFRNIARILPILFYQKRLDFEDYSCYNQFKEYFC